MIALAGYALGTVSTGVLLVCLHQANERATAAETQLAHEIQQEQRLLDRQKKEEEQFRRQLDEARAKSHALPAHESKTWQTYIP
jgi:hypothetical protein